MFGREYDTFGLPKLITGTPEITFIQENDSITDEILGNILFCYIYTTTFGLFYSLNLYHINYSRTFAVSN